ncbi:FHA domain-containing protein [Nostoc sp. TCL26-01]|uniref:FHA domain-containing protein n=1 Tax=Nostoc sp. TCL26-01 TaxID=2576904 RepID=UPI0015B9EE59|nr:FHA domain-containing protein [Nostoc sp. TCL26-01]QLE56995.1 FHA domain-containing protein [Nostoc sp. TCL26-01]
MQIQLSWIDPNTGNRREPILETPVAIGRQFSAMPPQNNGQRVSRIAIEDDLIADYHALIDWQNQELIIISQNTPNGIQVNGVQLNNGSLDNGDRLQIGSCEIVVNFTPTVSSGECDRMVGFLFKRRCGRTDRIDCPHCNPTYQEDYAYYSGYGDYHSGCWGSDYYYNRDRYYYNPETGNVDFTEADAMSLENEYDGDFEQNMGAS